MERSSGDSDPAVRNNKEEKGMLITSFSTPPASRSVRTEALMVLVV
jgi:hypothetical protein